MGGRGETRSPSNYPPLAVVMEEVTQETITPVRYLLPVYPWPSAPTTATLAVKEDKLVLFDRAVVMPTLQATCLKTLTLCRCPTTPAVLVVVVSRTEGLIHPITNGRFPYLNPSTTRPPPPGNHIQATRTASWNLQQMDTSRTQKSSALLQGSRVV